MNYIGSKLSILDFIDETVNDFVKSKGNKVILCDLFSRTGTVGKYFRKKGYTIISNDIEYYSYITAKHFIENNEEISFSKLKKMELRMFLNILIILMEKKVSFTVTIL